MPGSTDTFIVIVFIELTRLFVIAYESAIGGIGLDEPKVGEILGNVYIAIGTPFFIRSANPVYFYFILNVRSIMQSLC